MACIMIIFYLHINAHRNISIKLFCNRMYQKRHSCRDNDNGDILLSVSVYGINALGIEQWLDYGMSKISNPLIYFFDAILIKNKINVGVSTDLY